MIYSQKQVDRFWNNVEVSEPDDCWNWKRSHSNGYGQVGLRVDGYDRILKAHKVAWEIHNNERLSRDVRATHSCDNGLCCNPRHVVVQPDHLLSADVPSSVCGERHGMAKLTERQVRIIKYRLNALTTREIAAAFLVSSNTIWDIRKNITWRHV